MSGGHAGLLHRYGPWAVVTGASDGIGQRGHLNGEGCVDTAALERGDKVAGDTEFGKSGQGMHG